MHAALDVQFRTPLYLYPMQYQRFLSAIAMLLSLGAYAQTLTVTSNNVAYANSHNMNQASGYVVVKNTSATSQDYVVIRRRVGATGLVDSNYFCWDLCYPTWANQSQGTVTIGAGALAYDFTGYAYVRDTSANGQDTIWYTFKNAANSNDSLQVPVVFAFNRYVSTPEARLPQVVLRPQPARAGQRVGGISSDVRKVEWVDSLGRVRAVAEPNEAGEVFAPSEAGLWLLRTYHHGGVRTTKVLVR